jgi:hypothetical protein
MNEPMESGEKRRLYPHVSKESVFLRLGKIPWPPQEKGYGFLKKQ